MMSNCPECQPSTLTIHGEKQLRKRIAELETRNKVLEDANEILETRLSRARALLEEDVAIAAADKCRHGETGDCYTCAAMDIAAADKESI